MMSVLNSVLAPLLGMKRCPSWAPSLQFTLKLPALIPKIKAVVREPTGAAMGHATLLPLAAIVVTQSVSEIAGTEAGVVLGAAAEALRGKCVQLAFELLLHADVLVPLVVEHVVR